jgi:hypothetical protein
MLGRFNKILDMLSLDALKGVTVNRRLELLKPKPKSLINITLRVEKLSGKCLVEKDSDLVLRNLVRILYHLFANYESSTSAPSITVKDVTGTDRTGYVGGNPGYYLRSQSGWYGQGDLGVDTTGIVIGTGATPPSRTDYTLYAKISHGTGVGQITYQRMTYELLSDYQFRLNREFTNAGGDLSVAEAGLIYGTYISGTVAYSLLLLRDTFTAVTVTAGNGIRVRYTFNF